MNERLLHYIWQFQYYNMQQLHTSSDEPLQVIHPGSYNTNQGPDFLNAKIIIGNITWAGNVELHVLSSEWIAHRHSNDRNYDNVVLHVVWKHDAITTNWPFATLELYDRIPRLLLARYEELVQSNSFIPCEKNISSVPDLVMLAWKERMLAERLQVKVEQTKKLLSQNHQHWEETCWWLLARNFGVTVNAGAFETIARSIPVTLFAKHRQQLHQVEALLFGQAQLLNRNFKDPYPSMLRKEYLFLKKKYGLKKLYAPLFFMRMRPANFPTVRLAQLAKLVAENQQLFSLIKETPGLDAIADILNVSASKYWNDHYTFENVTAGKEKALGQQMLHNLLINTVVPLLFSYGYLTGNEAARSKALEWLETLSAEENAVTKKFEALGVANNTAADSQALLHMKREYCDQKKCLQCAIGNKILKK